MKYEFTADGVTLSEHDGFSIEKTLECGQCFRYSREGEGKYCLTAWKRILHIEQDGNKIFLRTNKDDFDNIWRNYFDLDTNYKEIEDELSKKDPFLEEAIACGRGIRILNQEIWETIISFIVSQNNHIPRIKQIIERLSENYGDKLEEGYAFPTPEQLFNVTQEDFFNMKTGFRAAYLADAVKLVKQGEINIEDFKNFTTSELKKELMKIKGVGPKVANCVMIFSCGRRESFPIDVWIKRMMENLYFEGKQTDIRQIQDFAEEKFGVLAGYAQQYLFHWARNVRRIKTRSLEII